MKKKEVIVIGGGLTGLSAAHVLTKAGLKLDLIEADSTVGGLSKTIVKDGFRFDLGGHRFFTKDRRIEDFVRNLLDGELVTVSRKSKIFMRNRYFDYPLKPFNAMFGLGVPTTARIIADYGNEKIRGLFKKPPVISLEDWVVSNFGRTMFAIYFKEYSEKVWGIPCTRISAEWVSQRIRGLSLATAVKNAFLKFNGEDLPTLADRFLYPRRGIGRISDRLREEVEQRNTVHTDTRVVCINRAKDSIESIVASSHGRLITFTADEYLSSMPLPHLVQMLHPSPPRDVLAAASRLRFRDLVIVTVMINRERATDQTWIYVPEKGIPFGRIHEPTNWSDKMAPEGKTLLVTEYFSFAGDGIWNESDEGLVDTTVRHLGRLGFVGKSDVIDSMVVRVPRAYPLFELGYRELCEELYEYLGRFRNLHIAGRTGMFRYYNMDHAIESGIAAAESVLGERTGSGGDTAELAPASMQS